MKKRKWCNRITIGVLVYVFVIIIFGMPFADRKLVSGYSRKVVFGEEAFSRFVYRLDNTATLTLIVCGILATALFQYVLGKICELDPKNLKAWVFRSSLCEMKLGKPEESMEYLQNAIKNIKENLDISNKDKATFEHFVGLILIQKHQPEEGMSHIKRALELDYDKSRHETMKKLEKGFCSEDSEAE